MTAITPQGCRRPLLAWLNIQALRAGALDEARRSRQRIGLVQESN
ncbi:MAG TPA: hypothetical protein VH278_02585 [Burkholderiaceae bacterium]|jgi:hypothetical protein|nr:hypothetical protein [Burkholderiaceae bacterium]